MKRISLVLLFFVSFVIAEDVEQIFVEQSTEMDLAYRLRDAMLSAVNEKDSAKIVSVMEMIDEKNFVYVRPIRLQEVEVVYLHAKMYRALTDFLVNYYRNLSVTKKDYIEEPDKDGLSIFVAKRLEYRDLSKHFFHVFENEVKNARISDAEKKKLELFVYLSDTYKDRNVAKHVSWLASSYVVENPDDPDSPWIDECISVPLKRFDYLEYSLKKRTINKEDFIRSKLYTSGFGLNVFLLSGGFANTFENYYNKSRFNPEEFEIKAELYLQLDRFVSMIDVVNLGVPGLATIAFGVGMVAFDSRYLKLRPYVEYGLTCSYVYVKDEHEAKFSDFDGESFITGVNVDFKILTTYIILSCQKLFSFSIVGKAGFTYTNIKTEYTWGDGFSFFGALGLGVLFW